MYSPTAKYGNECVLFRRRVEEVGKEEALREVTEAVKNNAKEHLRNVQAPYDTPVLIAWTQKPAPHRIGKPDEWGYMIWCTPVDALPDTSGFKVVHKGPL